MNKYRITNPYNNIVRDCKSRTTDEFPVWAIVGAAVDYGFQVYDNYKNGSSGYDAWVGDVNFVSVGASAINPTGKFKVVKTIAVEGIKAATEKTTFNDGLRIDKDIEAVAKKTAVNSAVSVAAGKLTDAGSKKAIQNANKEVSTANKQLKSAERQAQRSPNSTKKAGNVNTAQTNAQAVRNKQVRTQMLNSTVGKAPEATKQIMSTTSSRIQKNTQNE